MEGEAIRQVVKARYDAKRRIEDLDNIKTHGSQKRSLIKEIEESLVIDIANIQAKQFEKVRQQK